MQHKGRDIIRTYLANKNGNTLKVIGRYYGVYLPKFGLNKNLLLKDVTSEDGVEISDHMFVTIENHTTFEEGLKRGDIVIAEGTVYKYKKHNGKKKMLTDFSVIGKCIKKAQQEN